MPPSPARCPFSRAYSSSTNRFTFIPGDPSPPPNHYDANGNLLTDGTGTGSNTYQWDAEGRLISSNPGGAFSITYDALGRWLEWWWGAGYYGQMMYDPTGHKLAQMTATGSNMGDARVALPGGAVAHYGYGTAGLTAYWHPDWLGSIRFQSTPSRTVLQDNAFAPYGEDYALQGPQYPTFSFGGQNSDTSNLYDSGFRDYHTTEGRWVTPDPAGLAAVDLTNPQSLNRYAYALNNPTTLIDPLGLSSLNPGNPCSDIGFSDSNASCQQPGCYLNGTWFPASPDCFGAGWPQPPIGGGGGGGGGGGASAGHQGTTTGGTFPGVGTGRSSVGAANAFLGFHLACSQTKLSVPGLPGGSVSPANCVLFFLNIRLNAYSVATDLTSAGLVIAGSVTVIVPVAGGVAGGGPTFPFAFGSQGFGCLGVGGAFGTVGKAVNAGPIIGGDVGNYRNVLSGLSISVNAQSVNPLAGAQVIQNSSGLLYGPTFGTPGFSASASYSFCGSTP